MSVEFEDYSIKVKEALNNGAIKGLYLAAHEINSQAQDNSRTKTGQLKGSWRVEVNEPGLEAKIGSPLENAIWEEFGTGEYAVGGNGRKGGWLYEDNKGKTHFTRGKYPNRTLGRAFNSKRNVAIKLIEKSINDALK